MQKPTLFSIIFMAVLALTSCSTTKTSPTSPTAIKDQKLSTYFTDEGIKITYSLFGKLEKIEVYGQADAWKGNLEALAEADAYAKLVKFVHGSQVSTERRTKIIGTAIEKAEDNSLNKYMTNEGIIDVTDKQIDQEADDKSKNSSGSINSASRAANIVNTTSVSTITSITAQGRLSGIRKVKDYKENDGKLYVAVYSWSEQDQAASEYVRNRMNGLKN